MRTVLIFLLFTVVKLNAQDRLFYTNGKVREGIIVSISKDLVFYKESDTSMVEKIAKKELLMTENYKGIRHIFNADEESNDETLYKKTKANPGVSEKPLLNSLQVFPLGILQGRAGIAYEKLNDKGTIGLTFPLYLTFDVEGVLFPSLNDSASVPHVRSKELNLIGGIDVNFYINNKGNSWFFIGPKFRYGTNITFAHLEYYTFQTQLGWKFTNPDKRLIQHLSFGYGFAHIISSKSGASNILRNYFGLVSLSYRVGIKW